MKLDSHVFRETMYHVMITATVRELRNNFSALSKKLEAGETVQILSRGKPIARLVPEAPRKSLLGAAPTGFPLPDDIDEPLDLEWEALK